MTIRVKDRFSASLVWLMWIHIVFRSRGGGSSTLAWVLEFILMGFIVNVIRCGALIYDKGSVGVSVFGVCWGQGARQSSANSVWQHRI